MSVSCKKRKRKRKQKAGQHTLWSVTAQPLSGNFELAGPITKGEEAKNAQEKTDGLGRNGFDSSNIDGLGVVAEPVTKVGSRHHELVELLATCTPGHCYLKEGVRYITVAPCCSHQLDVGLERWKMGGGSGPGSQFWPSILEMPAILPAPKAWAGLAKRIRRIIPHRRGVILKEDMTVRSVL